MSKSYNYKNLDYCVNSLPNKETSEKLVYLAGLLYDLDRLKLGLSRRCYTDPNPKAIEKVKRLRLRKVIINKK